ncbi:TIGR03086 family protein [Nocardioides alpinus]|uniref:TIGR03086 family protein n=1 Tax=Nocardioides alpinus TaxID=748909 RepID=A0A1I0YL93_9ACTN|nr:TIGR03086 family metal-binding protein [Nocardioides alpinus]PKH43603.1 TIGR03086 family protein [Nocardioides alpinus]SFB14159.1 TIGR03086 family protein [Nocardioides alpinus]
MALPDAPAARHAVVTGEFSRVVAGTTDWSAPAPVDGWTARDVVDHLVGWFPGFLAAGGVELPSGPSVGDDPGAAWQHQARAVQDLVDTRGDESFTHPYAGTHRLADAVDRFYTADVFMHSWDLARASGQDARLDEDFAGDLLGGMAQMEGVLRSSGQYGAPVAVAADAPVVDRLMGFIGRDPAWTPPA